MNLNKFYENRQPMEKIEVGMFDEPIPPPDSTSANYPAGINITESMDVPVNIQPPPDWRPTVTKRFGHQFGIIDNHFSIANNFCDLILTF